MKIYHIVPKSNWSSKNKEYRGDTLDTQGFIHCSTKDQVVEVADYLFKGRTDLLLLVIDEDKIKSPIKYEDAGNGKLYPHIYGPLNADAVLATLEFKPKDDGSFALPTSLR